MKKQTPPKKLTLVKKTIAHVDSEQMKSAQGGTGITFVTVTCQNSYSLDLGCQI